MSIKTFHNAQLVTNKRLTLRSAQLQTAWPEPGRSWGTLRRPRLILSCLLFHPFCDDLKIYNH